MSNHYRVAAARLGSLGSPPSDRRACRRCGIEKSVSSKADRSKPFMCHDCKTVDRPMAIRLGIASGQASHRVKPA